MNSFNTKVNEAATKFLNCRGYEILDEPWKRDDGMLPVDIVAREDDTIVFVRAKGRNAESNLHFDDCGLDRDKLEAFAVNWFSDKIDEFDPCQFRFDAISMIVMGDDAKKALLRHHINALAVSIPVEGLQTSSPSEEGTSSRAA